MTDSAKGHWAPKPRECTEAMAIAAYDTLPGNYGDLCIADLEDIWQAMYDAAPPQPEIVEAPGNELYSKLVKRLLNPPFGTETSERLLMGQAADAIRHLHDALSRARGETMVGDAGFEPATPAV